MEVKSLASFLEAASAGADLWNGSPTATITWSTDRSQSEYQALKALGWSAGSDYGSYGCDWMVVYSPHPPEATFEEAFAALQHLILYGDLHELPEEPSEPYVSPGDEEAETRAAVSRLMSHFARKEPLPSSLGCAEQVELLNRWMEKKG